MRFCVTYWPRPSCQNRKCTCVNNRCIRRGISGYNLDCGRVELSTKLWCSQEEEWVSNYYITPVTGSSNQLEIRCGRENQHPTEWALRTPNWAVAVREKVLEWGPCPREAKPPGPWLSSPGEQEKNTVMALRVGVNMLQFCSVSNSLSHTTLSIKWEVNFSKELCCSSLLCCRYDSAYRCICIMWLYNICYHRHVSKPPHGAWDERLLIDYLTSN